MPSTPRDIDYGTILLPHIIATRMRLPLNCKSHGRTSKHRVVGEDGDSGDNDDGERNVIVMTFARQYWAWRWNNGHPNFLFSTPTEIMNDQDIAEELWITDEELSLLRHTSVHYCAHQQLIDIQNSTMHTQVSAALDYLSMSVSFSSSLRFFGTKFLTVA